MIADQQTGQNDINSDGEVINYPDFWSQVTETLHEGLCVLNAHGRVIFANTTALRLLDLSEQELIGENFYNFLYLHNEEDELVTASQHPLKKIISMGIDILNEEAILMAKSGSPITVRYTAMLSEVNGRYDHTVFAFADISDRKLVESELAQREQQLAESQKLTKIGSWEWNLVENTVTWTDSLYLIYGHPPGSFEPSYEAAMSQIHPEDRPRVERIIMDASDKIRPFFYRCRLLRADGQERTMDVRGDMEANANGELVRMWGTAHDITAQRVAERAMRRSEARFRTIFNHASIGIVVLDNLGKIIDANPNWQQMSQRDFDELHFADFISLFQEEDRGELNTAIQNLVNKKRKLYHQDHCLLLEDESVLWISVTLSPLHIAKNEPIRLIGLLEDISARKAVEIELREVKRRLARGRERERLFLAQELHDGPMQDLYGANYKLQAIKHKVSESAELTKLIGETQSLFQQVNESLRIICGELRPPALMPFGFEVALRSHVENFLNLYPHFNVSLDLYEDKQTLPKYVRLTLFRLSQELLNNIAKHSEAKNIAIRFDIMEENIILEIQDDGKGFEVPDRWIDLAREGHLGLVGASERADVIDGKLIVLSTPQKGTIVRIIAPKPAVELSTEETGVA